MATLNVIWLNLLFPDVTKTIAILEKEYPARALPSGAEVTRFAPSPTGFLHTGSLFTSLIGYTIAKAKPRRFLFPS
jgi:glutamyl-tRNA synthetase